jgi:hypothetical protein
MWMTGMAAAINPASRMMTCPAIARDGRWLLQLYDNNFTRTEMMIRQPVQTPCCSPNLDDFKPDKAKP